MNIDFDIIGNIGVKVLKSNDNNYHFQIESSTEDVEHIADILDDTLKLY